MLLSLERPHVEALVEQFPRLASLKDQLRLGSQAAVSLGSLEAPELDFLDAIYRQGDATSQARAAQIATLRQALSGGGEHFGPEDLEDVVPALARYLLEGAIRGWLFTAAITGRPLPYVVTRIDYTPAGNDETGKVILELKAYARGGQVTQVMRITAGDITGKRLPEILAAKGYLKETQALIDAYDATCERYLDWRARQGAQFSGRGTGYFTQDPLATHRDTDWARKDVTVLSTGGQDARLVNDEGILPQKSPALDATGDILGHYLRKAAKSNLYGSEDEAREAVEGVPKGLFTQLPLHPFILMFHLELHAYLWVHTEDIRPYAYQPDLKEKLILPGEQTDLIDILTAEMDVLMSDIVAGKSGGTTVLCAGPPGVGKTLTAEVYSEIIQRPLYRVHSGQLGLNVAAMEAALRDALTRAQRWGAVMLIDEADVYIRRRDDDMTANAVVGVFLRVLEYFNGLLFLTTNRVSDIDEAIVSRCIALIRYEAPDAPARRRIWQVMLRQFELEVGEDLVAELVEQFPSATGRDIKGLARLVSKFCRHKQVPPSMEVFRRCALFRAMEQVRPAAAANEALAAAV